MENNSQNRMEKPFNRLELPAQDDIRPYCRNCGSESVKVTRTEHVTDITVKRRYKCQRCGAAWNAMSVIPAIDRMPESPAT